MDAQSLTTVRFTSRSDGKRSALNLWRSVTVQGLAATCWVIYLVRRTSSVGRDREWRDEKEKETKRGCTKVLLNASVFIRLTLCKLALLVQHSYSHYSPKSFFASMYRKYSKINPDFFKWQFINSIFLREISFSHYFCNFLSYNIKHFLFNMI